MKKNLNLLEIQIQDSISIFASFCHRELVEVEKLLSQQIGGEQRGWGDPPDDETISRLVSNNFLLLFYLCKSRGIAFSVHSKFNMSCPGIGRLIQRQ